MGVLLFYFYCFIYLFLGSGGGQQTGLKDTSLTQISIIAQYSHSTYVIIIGE